MRMRKKNALEREKKKKKEREEEECSAGICLKRLIDISVVYIYREKTDASDDCCIGYK
jgi:hypothetical protein